LAVVLSDEAEKGRFLLLLLLLLLLEDKKVFMLSFLSRSFFVVLSHGTRKQASRQASGMETHFVLAEIDHKKEILQRFMIRPLMDAEQWQSYISHLRPSTHLCNNKGTRMRIIILIDVDDSIPNGL